MPTIPVNRCDAYEPPVSMLVAIRGHVGLDRLQQHSNGLLAGGLPSSPQGEGAISIGAAHTILSGDGLRDLFGRPAMAARN